MVSSASRISSRSGALGSAPSGAHRHRRELAATLLLALLAACLAAPSARAAVPAVCDKVASPEGSDAATGAATAPLRTAQALANSLAPGQVGCLHAGSYGGGLRFNHGGTAAAPIVLRSYPGERAQIMGRLWVPRGSDYVTVAELDLNGNHQSESKLLPSPTINANHATFESDDVTNDHTEICFDVGSATYGAADSTVIANDRIHDCGVMPAANHDHGIYVQDATNTRIVDNLITHNADRGIQLYPSSTGAVISGNVISENGEGIIFSGEGGVASNGNVVEHNLIVNSLIRSDVESWYPAGNPVGVGNVAQNNCVSARGIDTEAGGFTARSNVAASAGELLPTADGGLRPVSGSACANVLPEVVTRLGIEGAPSGGAPNSVGKASGGGATPPPAEKGRAASAHVGARGRAATGSARTPGGKATRHRAGSGSGRRHHARAVAKRRRATHKAHARRLRTAR
jgi:parallel beta-helix repeat protein